MATCLNKSVYLPDILPLSPPQVLVNNFLDFGNMRACESESVPVFHVLSCAPPAGTVDKSGINGNQKLIDSGCKVDAGRGKISWVFRALVGFMGYMYLESDVVWCSSRM